MSCISVLAHLRWRLMGRLFTHQTPLSEALDSLFTQASNSNRLVSPENFLAVCSQLSGGRWNGRVQEDAFEFLDFLLKELPLEPNLFTRFVKTEACSNVNCGFNIETPASGINDKFILLPILNIPSDEVLLMDLFNVTESLLKRRFLQCPSCHALTKSEKLSIPV